MLKQAMIGTLLFIGATLFAEGEGEKLLAKTDEALKAMETGVDLAARGSLLDNSKYRQTLIFHQFVKTVTPEALTRIHGLSKGKAFFSDVLTPKIMNDFLSSGPVEKGPRSLEILYLLYANDPQKECIRNPLYTRLYIACALSANGNNYNINEVYKKYKANHQAGYLHKSFDNLTVREMRHAIHGNPYDLDYLIGQNTRDINGYGGAAWFVAYRLHNCFGESIHGPRYYKPWDHVYHNHAERAHKVGGVCGALSTYGTNSARAHGVPATTGGQPGHCAYMVRHDDGRWGIHNYVGRWTGVHHNFWGLHEYPFLNMMEDCFKVPANYARADAACWMAARFAAAESKTFDPAIEKLYRIATETAPCGYPMWREWGEYLKRCDGITNDQWREWSLGVARGFKEHQSMGWRLIMIYAAPAVGKSGGDAARVKLYAAVHNILKETTLKVAEPVNFSNIISQQEKTLGKNDDAKFELLTVMLKAHDGSKNNFPTIMKWGTDKFLKNEKYKTKYLAAINDFFSKRGKSDGLTSFVRDGIRTASEMEDVDLFQQLVKMAEEVDPPKTDAKPFVKSQNRLISAAGLLKTSSSQHEDTLNYKKVIDDSQPSGFHTRKEKNPWAMVILKGDAEVSEIYIRNRTGQNAARSLPLVVSISIDGRTWKEVFRTEKVTDEWLIDLSKSPERARYIKAERPADAKNEFFHLSKFQVYGKNLF